tara:strand:+ start:278 stop:688 length:411 start_codon:yes stop_codon:yes gene_type:complete
MALYHPPKTITSNAAPAITADLAYESHGKCGYTRILRVTGELEDRVFNAATEGKGNAWKMVVLSVGTYAENTECGCDNTGKFEAFTALNININDSNKMVGAKFEQNFEIMADITYVRLDRRATDMVVVLYMDCTQS